MLYAICGVAVYQVRPDQINLLLLGFFEPKIGPSDRKKKKKAIKWEWLEIIIELLQCPGFVLEVSLR